MGVICVLIEMSSLDRGNNSTLDNFYPEQCLYKRKSFEKVTAG